MKICDELVTLQVVLAGSVIGRPVGGCSIADIIDEFTEFVSSACLVRQVQSKIFGKARCGSASDEAAKYLYGVEYPIGLDARHAQRRPCTGGFAACIARMASSGPQL